MRINNNISAMNTYSRLNSANNAKSGSLAKLSSGLRINRAGDDAAGLAISEKMRGQIGGLKQATRNAQDGISMIQTAEGALSETHLILQRMRELSVQASSDTNTTDDRKEIQKEMNQLTSEITRIGNTTEFNTQKVLKGGEVGAGAPGEATKAVFSFKMEGAGNVAAGNNVTIGCVVYTAVASDGDDTTDGTFKIGANLNATGTSLAEEINKVGTYNATFDTATGTMTLTQAEAADVSSLTVSTDATGVTVPTNATVETSYAAGGGATTGDFSATLQIGANQSQNFEVKIRDMRSSALGLSGTAGDRAVGATEAEVNGASFAKATDTDYLTDVSNGVTPEYGLDLSSSDKASAAITVIDQAIATVSAERSKLGSVQNRLDHTINNLTATAENLSEAESRIRDVDMAEEMMEFTKNNILSQAATSMLAQANQMPQSVLQLLQ